MSVALDPEDMHEVLEAFRRCATAEIEKRGGFIAQYLGDGALAYFGYPVAQNRLDDAESWFHAALHEAREQKARLWELRAALALARIQQSKGNHDAATELIRPVYHGFTEGKSITEMREAQQFIS